MKRGPSQVALALTRLLNAFTWGDATQSFSARCGYALYRQKDWALEVVPLIDLIFGAGHCVREAQREGLIPAGWSPVTD